MASSPGDPGAVLLLRLGRRDLAPAFHFAPTLGFPLRLGIETLKLARALLPRLLQIHLRFRPARALVVRRLRGGRLEALPIVELLLPLLLVDFELLARLLLARVGGWRLRGPLLLLHLQLECVLLLLPLQLMLLQRPRARILGACSGAGKACVRQRRGYPCHWNGNCALYGGEPPAERSAGIYPCNNRGLRHQRD
jgi:hypothetical protein